MFQSQTSTQTSTLCVPSSGQSSLYDRRIFHELEQYSCLCISFCPEKDRPVSVQNGSNSTSLAATNMVLRGSTTICLSSSSSFTLSKESCNMEIPVLNRHIWELSSNQLEIKISQTLQFCLQIKANRLRNPMMRNGSYIPVGIIEGRLIRSRGPYYC